MGLSGKILKSFQQKLLVGAIGAASLMLGIGTTPVEASDNLFIRSSASSPPPSGALELCKQYAWACARSGAISMSSAQEMQLVRQINRKVNASTHEVTDQLQYKTREVWALPTSRGGDCEDFALLKKRDLIEVGIDPSRLLIATVLDRQRNAHAVLVYRSSQGDLVLDNLTSTVKPWSAKKYLFLRMQNPDHPEKWVGVYRKS